MSPSTTASRGEGSEQHVEEVVGLLNQSVLAQLVLEAPADPSLDPNRERPDDLGHVLRTHQVGVVAPHAILLRVHAALEQRVLHDVLQAAIDDLAAVEPCPDRRGDPEGVVGDVEEHLLVGGLIVLDEDLQRCALAVEAFTLFREPVDPVLELLGHGGLRVVATGRRQGAACLLEVVRDALDGQMDAQDAVLAVEDAQIGTRKARKRDHPELGPADALPHLEVEDVGRPQDHSYVSTRASSPARSSSLALDVSRRASNALRRRDVTVDTSALTVRDLMRIRNFGARSLLDVLTAADSLPAAPHAQAAQPRRSVIERKPSRAVSRAAADLAGRRWSGRVSARDPRLGSLVRALEPAAESAREAAELVADRPVTAAEARHLTGALRDLIAEGDSRRRLTLKDELADVVGSAVASPTAETMVLARLGLGGRPPATLEQAGELAGVTRERVRQVEKRFREVISGSETWTPVLDRVLRAVQQAAPATVQRLERDLRCQRLIDQDFSVDSVFAAAKAFGKSLPITNDRQHGLVRATGTSPPDGIVSLAKRLITHWGATTIDEVCAELAPEAHHVEPAFVRLVLGGLPDFRWLDEGAGWFWLRDTSRNRLLNQVEKIMAVAGSITIAELRDGVGRHHRMQGFRPPRHVLAELCEDTGMYHRSDDRIIGGKDLPDWRDVLGKNESTLVEVLFDHGFVMRRDDLEQEVVDRQGLNRNSFYVYLSYSPILARYAPGVFGLRGAPVTAAEVDALIPPRARTQVLQDQGWTPEGRLWVAYRISAAGERSGVLGVPGALKKLVQGSFTLSTEDGRVVGTLVVEDNMWGLSPFYRRYGIEEGDYLVVVFDLQQRASTVIAGTQELLLRFQVGE